MNKIGVPANGNNLKNDHTNGTNNGNSNGNASPNNSPPTGSPWNKGFLGNNNNGSNDIDE